MEASTQKSIFAALAVLILAAPFAIAADGIMTSDELTALVGSGKTINLGGAGEGFSGTLDIKADGTASGSVKTDGGKTLIIVGTWTINQNHFCRKWKDLDGGKEVCEAWKKIGDNRVEVQLNEKKIGLNWW